MKLDMIYVHFFVQLANLHEIPVGTMSLPCPPRVGEHFMTADIDHPSGQNVDAGFYKIVKVLYNLPDGRVECVGREDLDYNA